MNYLALQRDLKKVANPEKALVLQKFFKTGPGEYGEGDIFLGVVVPDTRKIVKKYLDLDKKDILKLLRSRIHEERLAALLLLINRFNFEKEKIFQLYLKNTKYINNWDLVDLSADKIIGGYLFDKPKDILFKLASSRNIWERRIAIIATFNFIKRNRFKETLEISEILLQDDHELIQKAVGWMLREVGKRNMSLEEKFLKKHHKKMPRTMLRYAIEKFPEKTRKYYLLR